MREVIRGALGELRHEPIELRIRATLGEHTLLDSRRALLVWEPRRVVPSYAVPAEDVLAELASHTVQSPGPLPDGLLHPGIPFAGHSAEGEPVLLRAPDATREVGAFRLSDPELDGYVIVDFRGPDAWYEEEELVVGHPRDPFHRVDTRRSRRHVRIELDGELLAESSRPMLVTETQLPARFYLPREDVRAELEPSEHRTWCAYKGEASYWSLAGSGEGGRDLVWSYQQPLPEATALTGLVAFFDERVDVVLDGERRERPRTQWSRAILDEAASSSG
jgi:uncharacterized protein (DUF427 family)